MRRLAVEGLGIRRLHDAAEIHYRDAIGDVFHDGEVVGDEQVSQAALTLQVEHEVQHLALN
jgi:hypothetical protein